MRVALVSCAKSKMKYPCKAKEMYSKSVLFRRAYGHVIKRYDQVYILSAKYGLLDPESIISPYDISLYQFSENQKKIWASNVFKQIESKRFPKRTRIHFYAGKQYRGQLEHLLRKKYCVRVPLAGLSIGKQLAFYKREGEEDCV